MQIRKAALFQIQAALDAIQSKYDNNLEFARLEGNGHGAIAVRLRVKDSHGKGARLGFYSGAHGQRHLISACWHVHGDFFDALFQIAPDATVKAGTRKITADAGNWEDWNIGSMMYPLYYSEACNCAEWR